MSLIACGCVGGCKVGLSAVIGFVEGHEMFGAGCDGGGSGCGPGIGEGGFHSPEERNEFDS